MTAWRRGTAPHPLRPSLVTPYRLDLLPNPYGPSLRVFDALSGGDAFVAGTGEIEEAVIDRLAKTLAAPRSWLTLANGIDELLAAALLLHREDASVVLCPPTDSGHARLVGLLGMEPHLLPRSHRFAVEIDPAELDLPDRSVVLVMSPNDPTGTLLSPQDAVRLARRASLVVIDERHGAYSPRSLLPLVREFDNVVIARTFETWAGLSGLPLAYAVSPPAVAARLRAARLRPEIATAALVAARATLADLAMVEATVTRVREEKSRLYRTLRKLNMIRPHPSWANFILARIERGDPAFFARALADQGITIHRPPHAEFVDCFRISATTAEATGALKDALIEAAAGL